MSGFVYVWYDRGAKRFYVGSHWGSETDGYVCSSRWMRNAYRSRKADFKRRILSRVTSSRADLFIEEARWIFMIKDHELRTRYYNLKKWVGGHWTVNGDTRSVREKIKAARKKQAPRPPVTAEERAATAERNRSRISSDESRSRMSASQKSRPPRSAETRAKIGAASTGRKLGPPSAETRAKIGLANSNPSEATREKQRSARLGKALSSEHRSSISAGLVGRVCSEETRAKIRLARARRSSSNSQPPLG